MRGWRSAYFKLFYAVYYVFLTRHDENSCHMLPCSWFDSAEENHICAHPSRLSYQRHADYFNGRRHWPAYTCTAIPFIIYHFLWDTMTPHIWICTLLSGRVWTDFYATCHHCILFVSERKSKFTYFFDTITNYLLTKSRNFLPLDSSKYYARHFFYIKCVP